MLLHPRNHKVKIILMAVFLLSLTAGIFLLFNNPDAKPPMVETETLFEQPVTEPVVEETPVARPFSVQLEVPFTAQAPTANWDELHNEACEEASVIMAWAYFNNITSLPPLTVEAEISKLTEWQQTNYGYYLSITTPETARMAEDVYGLDTEIKTFSFQAIKEALAEDKLVILPAQGQLLGNPNFTAPGPPYHMLVITGYYTKNGIDYFVTNDPGTRRGENYTYTAEVIETATGNYSHATKLVDTSEKDIIIVSN